MPKTTNEILNMYYDDWQFDFATESDANVDNESFEKELWYSQEEYNDLKEMYELTKVSHTEMCDTIIKLRKYIEHHKLDLEQLQKELIQRLGYQDKENRHNVIVKDVFNKFKELK